MPVDELSELAKEDDDHDGPDRAPGLAHHRDARRSACFSGWSRAPMWSMV
jgi:hypothetical protein